MPWIFKKVRMMTAKKPTYIQLEKRLDEAEEILEALRGHKIDAVIGTDQISMLRLKQVEDQLQEQTKISDNRLKEIESIYQNVPVGLCVLGRNLTFKRVNKHLAKMNGISANAHIGRSLTELFPELAKKIAPGLQQVIETGKAKLNVEVCGETPDQPGVERYWLEHWLPLYGQEGEVIGVNMVIEEITERKAFEDKLQQLNATLEKRVAERTKIAEQRANKLRKMSLQMIHVEEKERQRLARVLHDGLQQLLIGAKFNSSLIKNRLKGQDELKDEIDQLNKILDQSIEASRSLSYELSPPILHDQGLVAALEWLADMRHMKGLKIEIYDDSEVPELSQNLKVFFFQTVRELLVNIIKHAETDRAKVHIFSDEKNINVEVIDEGKGFDTAKLKTGSSQGLRNIREKLDLMNGGMTIESQPGRGSHFTLQVPLDNNIVISGKDEAEQKTAYNIVNDPGNDIIFKEKTDSISILIVDDHQVMRNGLVRLLGEESNFNIIGEAGNGVEAVDFVQKTQPDVIVMDVTMPKMNGIEATRVIHQEFPDIHIIGLSMHEEKEYSTLMKKAGATELLNKGGPADELFAAVQNASS